MVLLDAASPLGPLQLNATFVIELVAFLIMLGILARWVYPPVMRAAEARQKQIADQLAAADRARKGAEQYLAQSDAAVQQGRVEAQRIIEAANRSAERLQKDAQEKAQAEAHRIVEQAKKEIDAERERAIQAIRLQLADMVVSATERVIGESLDGERDRKLIERAIQEVGAEQRAS
jgi:F-type H+-transporting ATPase subunit b